MDSIESGDGDGGKSEGGGDGDGEGGDGGIGKCFSHWFNIYAE